MPFPAARRRIPADKPGVGNMVASLLDEGSGDLDSKTFHERLERRAIDLSFNVTRDYFRGSLRMLKENNDEAFDLLRLALTSPHFDAGRCRTHPLAGAVGPAPRDHQPECACRAANSSRRLSAHPYGRPANGTMDSVPTITVADLRDYVRRVLAKDTLKIAVVGDVDPATLGQLLDETSAACRPRPV